MLLLGILGVGTAAGIAWMDNLVEQVPLVKSKFQRCFPKRIKQPLRQCQLTFP